MIISSASDKGLIREKNQDSLKTVLRDDGTVLVVVCDGIGGAKAGEVASSMATNYMCNEFEKKVSFESIQDAKRWFDVTLRTLNLDIVEASKSNLNFNGMGTTLVAVLLHPLFILAVNIGDSRIYRFEKGHHLTRVSQDHSLVFEMVERGEITEEEAADHPQRNYLTNALGISQTLRIDTFNLTDCHWDYLMLCSDGLHGYVEEHAIRRVLLNDKMNLDEKTHTLINLANEAGGYDNVSVALVMKEGIV